MSNVKPVRALSKPASLRKSGRLLRKRLEAAYKPIETTVDNKQVSEERLQSEAISYIESYPLTPETQDMGSDLKEDQTETQESPIVSTPRRNVGRPRSLNITACIRANESVQQQAELMGYFEAVTLELIRLGVREHRFVTIEDALRCYYRRDLMIQ